MLLPVRILRSSYRVSNIIVRSVYTARMKPTPWTPNSYPTARRSDHVDEYKSEAKGLVKVADPYQWLEKNSAETDAWTTTQEAFTRAYLDQNVDRVKLENEIRSNTDYAKVMIILYWLILSLNENITYMKHVVNFSSPPPA